MRLIHAGTLPNHVDGTTVLAPAGLSNATPSSTRPQASLARHCSDLPTSQILDPATNRGGSAYGGDRDCRGPPTGLVLDPEMSHADTGPPPSGSAHITRKKIITATITTVADTHLLEEVVRTTEETGAGGRTHRATATQVPE